MDLIIKSRKELVDFLKLRSQEDSEIAWICPKCGAKNIGAYFSRESPCAECHKFAFPRLNLKNLLENEAEANQIAKDIESCRKRISCQREVVEDLESELAEEKGRLEDLKEELSSLKSCDLGKVKVDW